MFAAIVHAPDGVRFITVEDRAEQVIARLTGYVRRRCDDVLWSAEASRVRALIDARESRAAIAAYFAHVGSRWDEEWLEILVMTGPREPLPAARRRAHALLATCSV